MHNSLAVWVVMVVIALWWPECAVAEHPEVIAELPNQPMVFNSPEELRTYLQELDKYFAIVGRPRFGRTLGVGYSMNVYPYFRSNGMPPSQPSF